MIIFSHIYILQDQTLCLSLLLNQLEEERNPVALTTEVIDTEK